MSESEDEPGYVTGRGRKYPYHWRNGIGEPRCGKGMHLNERVSPLVTNVPGWVDCIECVDKMGWDVSG